MSLPTSAQLDEIDPNKTMEIVAELWGRLSTVDLLAVFCFGLGRLISETPEDERPDFVPCIGEMISSATNYCDDKKGTH